MLLPLLFANISEKYEVSTGNAFSPSWLAITTGAGARISFRWILNQMCVLNGTLAAPASPADPAAPTPAKSKALADYQLRLTRAYAELSLRIDPAWRQPISNLREQPSEAWKKLEEAYGSKLSGTRAVLFGELTSMRYDGVTSIQVFYGRMEELRSKLKVAGQTVEESHFLNFLLNALPSTFDQFVSTVDYDKDTISGVVARLRQLELRQSMIAARDGHGTESAFSANFKSKKGSSGGKKDRNGSSEGGDKMSKITCYNCQQKGHFACKCPKKKVGDGGKKQKGREGYAEAAKAPVGSVFTAMEVGLAASEDKHARTYYLDSGASGHYVPEKEDLHDLRPFSPPVNITVANSQSILALGTGTLRVASRVNNEDVFIELRDVYWVADLGTRLLSIEQNVL